MEKIRKIIISILSYLESSDSLQFTILHVYRPASTAQVDACPTGRQYSLVEIDHELFSTVILALPLIQEGQLPVSERMCTNTG